MQKRAVASRDGETVQIARINQLREFAGRIDDKSSLLRAALNVAEPGVEHLLDIGEWRFIAFQNVDDFFDAPYRVPTPTMESFLGHWPFSDTRRERNSMPLPVSGSMDDESPL